MSTRLVIPYATTQDTPVTGRPAWVRVLALWRLAQVKDEHGLRYVGPRDVWYDPERGVADLMFKVGGVELEIADHEDEPFPGLEPLGGAGAREIFRSDSIANDQISTGSLNLSAFRELVIVATNGTGGGRTLAFDGLTDPDGTGVQIAFNYALGIPAVGAGVTSVITIAPVGTTYSAVLPRCGRVVFGTGGAVGTNNRLIVIAR